MTPAQKFAYRVVERRRKQAAIICDADKRKLAGSKAPKLTVGQMETYMEMAESLGSWN